MYAFMPGAPKPLEFSGPIQELEVLQEESENSGFRLETSGADFQAIPTPT